ncbi:MAG: dTDP-glucose 4,6-dehydratase [Armatimonadetes bacterium]|nr:dTDP-glucose 4,6-dehydratase [Armatimonadota bacterium]NOG91903.1 dTDP-glucose 4,6-dehydratase [Armatimonadota bacterium]
MNLLVCGGAGFIGSAYCRHVLATHPNDRVVVFDALTYAGHESTLAGLRHDPRFSFVKGRIEDERAVLDAIREHEITAVVNFAAETHNDRSLMAADAFLQTNVVGVYVLLEAVRNSGVERLLHVSTDEVYGSLDEGEWTEESPIQPNTPYSASKAAGDLQCRAHFKSYGTNVVVTRGGNTYGPYQYPEKLISFFATRLFDGKPVPVYGEGTQRREWIHASDHASGIDTVLRHGKAGEVYNISDSNERTNMEVVRILLEELGRGPELVKHIEDPRKGAHDARYSMSSSKLRSLGWKPTVDFESGLRETVRWYKENESWWRPITESQEFKAFTSAFYGPSLGPDL